MTEQERIQKPGTDHKKEGAAETLAGGEEQVSRATAGLEAASAVFDDILADFIPPEGPTEIIGGVASVKRPPLRQISSEDFIRAFRQRTGQ
jgi:hypothetical protein